MYPDDTNCLATRASVRGVRPDRRKAPAYCRCGPEIDVNEATLPITESSVIPAQA
jgi:hypothetical protein